MLTKEQVKNSVGEIAASIKSKEMGINKMIDKVGTKLEREASSKMAAQHRWTVWRNREGRLRE